MNNSLSTFLFSLSAITAYAIIYRSISAMVDTYSKFRKKRKLSINMKHRELLLTKEICSLSKKDIAILKFILLQDNHIAWLPDSMKNVIFLHKKGFITLFSDRKKITPHSSSYYLDSPYSYLFAISPHIEHILLHLPHDFSKKWKKVKPNFLLEDIQYNS